MKKKVFGIYGFLICIVFLSFLCGCVSVSNSPNPRYFTLHALDKESIKREFNIPHDTIIGIGPVRIPEYLNRPQIVVKSKDETVHFDEFNRWAESLDFSFARLINENLTSMFKGASFVMFPWDLAISVKYQVVVDILRLEDNSNKELHLVAQWSVIDLAKKKAIITRRSELQQNIYPQNYYGLTQALSEAVFSLSADIAEQLNFAMAPSDSNSDN